ncbi:MAG TPA: hypothetical protein VFE50_20670 [Cyclobacteriaceae bacterium]|nr:hypothetical protein [Cyclobacteriaceae bacterium]
MLVLCPKCSAKVFGTIDISPESHGVPDDLSTVQVGSTGKYKEKKFEVIGRIRIQMIDDFRNLWCAVYDNDKTLWICQSHESIAFADDNFKSFPPKSDIVMRAGGKVIFGDSVKLKVVFVGSMLYMHFEGEIAHFPHPQGDFAFVHAVNERGNTAIIVTKGNDMDKTELLWGVTKQIDQPIFENTRTIDGWQR